LYARFSRDATIEDIRAALECDQKALELTPADDHRLIAKRQGLIGVNLSAIYRLEQDLELLNQSVIYISQAIKGTPHTDATRQEWRENRYNLAVSLNYRYQRTKNEGDLISSIAWLKEVIDDYGRLANADSDTMHELALQYLNLYDQDGDVAYLEKAVDTCEFALTRTKQTSGSDILLRRQEGELARCYHALFIETGDSAYLEQSIDHINVALELTPTDSVQYGEFQGFIGAFISSRYRQRRNVEDLLQAIDLDLERSADYLPATICWHYITSI
jgi:tetratricopeptide (TPR) repeat protein